MGKDLLAAHAGATLIYYHKDHLSVRASTDGSSGTAVGQQAHYPYGETWYATGTTTDYFFTSYKRDAESGNDYAVFRYDVNRLGRFSSPDPIVGSFAAPQSLNRYAYVAGDPVNRIDPNGLQFFDDFFSPPFGFCSPFPFRVTLLIDGFEVPGFFLCRSLFGVRGTIRRILCKIECNLSFFEDIVICRLESGACGDTCDQLFLRGSAAWAACIANCAKDLEACLHVQEAPARSACEAALRKGACATQDIEASGPFFLRHATPADGSAACSWNSLPHHGLEPCALG